MNEIEEFENEFKNFIGSKHAIAVSSGTTALISACIAVGLKDNQKVITTPFTFIASSTCILHQRAIPIFADINNGEKDYNINSKDIFIKYLENYPNIVGIIPVHLFGKPCNMKDIMTLAKNNNLWVIEDCAQSFGAKYEDKYVGTFGDIGCFSFYATKNLWTYEGGMIITNNDDLADKLRMIINHGSKERYIHETLGYNFRMSRDHALMGMTMLKLHNKGCISELGSYGIKNGHYPYVLYDQPLFKKLGITGNCPNAERAALEARKYFNKP